MKKHVRKIIISALLGFAVSAQAVEFRDADLLNVLISPGGIYSDTFNIVSPDGTASFTVNPSYSATTQHGGTTFTSNLGYTPGDPIEGGTVNFWFRNARNDAFQVVVGLDTVLASVGSGSVVFLSESLGATLIADLEADGILSYTVTNIGPTNIRFDYALLVAVVSENDVPEGGATAMLLGFGLIGLAGIRRLWN